MSIYELFAKDNEDNFRKILSLEDWVYRDIPWITDEFFHELIDIVGEDNIRIISGSTRSINGVTSRRCSCMLSPEAIERLKNASN